VFRGPRAPPFFRAPEVAPAWASIIGRMPVSASEPPAIDRAPGAGEPDRAEAASRVLRRFRLVFNAVKTHFQQVEKQAGIGGAQLWALSLVRDQPGIGVSALARAMDVHQTTASNLVRSLVEHGFVESHRSGIDRRASQLKITRAGARVVARAPGPFTGVLPQALAKLDEGTLQRLDSDLAALLEMLDTDKRAARIPLAQM
jgi:DNA-binding MarR family transcriptional regulator